MQRIEKWADITIGYRTIDPSPETSRRQRETLAVRQLADAMIGPNTEIGHTPEGAPVLSDGRIISISHSIGHAAIALANSGRIGIDVETLRPQLQKVAPRVLSDAELPVYGSSLESLLRAWTMKEAVYKAAGKAGLELASGIRLPENDTENPVVEADGQEYTCSFLNINTDTLLCVARQTDK